MDRLNRLRVENVFDEPLNETVYTKVKDFISDELFLDYLKKSNGGYYCDKSLHLFSCVNKTDCNNIEHINNIITDNYIEISSGLYCFGEDIFGNLFAFSDDGIIFFNIETGERETIAENFSAFLDVLLGDIDYYSGQSYLLAWENLNRKLKLGERLCPKIPFVLGGEYKSENLYAKDYIENLKFNASIAKQVYNLPDGTEFKLKIT